MNLKKIIAGAKGSEGGVYRTASMKTMLLACATTGGKNVFYVLMMYAGYMANEGYGILLAITGIITMVKTIFDGVCDPIVAAIFDRMPVGKLGKIRKFLLIGYTSTIISAILMFNLLANKFEGVLGIVVYCVIYALFVIGYTTLNHHSHYRHQRPQAAAFHALYLHCLSVSFAHAGQHHHGLYHPAPAQQPV